MYDEALRSELHHHNDAILNIQNFEKSTLLIISLFFDLPIVKLSILTKMYLIYFSINFHCANIQYLF